MQSNPLEQTLEQYCRDGSELGITLRDGSFFRGRVKDYDGYVIILEGAPDTMVYRHSILKLAAAEAGPLRPERQARPPESQARPRSTPRPPQRPQRPQKPRPERPHPKEPTAEKEAGLGAMGEAMMKWLKSQKGGE